MSAVELEGIVPAEDYLLVEKVEETETSSGLIVLSSTLNLVRIMASNIPGAEYDPGIIGILFKAPENDLRNGQYLTHKTNLIGTASIKE